ncbi:MAG TPA: Mur ligase family protein [Candidatus Eisenbacteria bacterium]|nr:Mur ligase family protein [Candidatus Eisenbacteria bacterium]
MRVEDSRRLTGPNLLLDGPGALLDVRLEGADPVRAAAAWRAALGPLLDGVGWSGAPLATRPYPHGVLLAFGAPADVLYAATEVNEAAWSAAAASLEGAAAPDREAALRGLRASIEAERKPWLLALAAEAKRRGATLLADDKRISVGLGAGSVAWPAEESDRVIPRIDWSVIHDVPTLLVTGTNGKSTTVRLLGAMVAEAGRTAGVTSTDAVTVGADVVAEGDYSGPNGARTVLRDRRVEIGVLEVARGGILRRGLPLPAVSGAIVTNVANDHLGEFGIEDLSSLAEAKLVVAKAVGPEGRVVLNADDPLLLERGARLGPPVTWFTLDAAHPFVARHLAGGGDGCLLEGDTLVFARAGSRSPVARVGEIPIAFGGAARHNVANALAAIGGAMALGLPADAIGRALRAFRSDPGRNPGRANVWDLGGVTAIVDFAHNPHGVEALARMTAALPAARRALVIGQAGDRDDASIRDLARAAWAMRPDRIFVKELEDYLRGRERGAVPAILEGEFRELGAAASSLSRHDGELAAIHEALAWSRPGDLVLLTTHERRREVILLLDSLATRGWKPGDPVPR